MDHPKIVVTDLKVGGLSSMASRIAAAASPSRPASKMRFRLRQLEFGRV